MLYQRRPRWRKPLQPVRVDLGHPQARGLAAFFYHAGKRGLWDAVTGRWADATEGAPSVRGTPEGPAFYMPGDTRASLVPRNPTGALTDATSLVARLRLRAVPGASVANIFAYKATGTDRGLTLGIDSAQTGLAFGTLNSAVGISYGSSTGTVDTGVARTVGISFQAGSGSNYHPYADGAALAPSFTAGTASGSVAATIYFGRDPNGYATYPDVEVIWAAAFNRLLTDADHAWWHRNAFQVLEGRPRSFAFTAATVAAAADESINASTEQFEPPIPAPVAPDDVDWAVPIGDDAGDAAAYTTTDAFEPPVPDPVDVDDLGWLPPVGDDAGDAAAYTATDAFDPPDPIPVDVDDLAWLPPVGADAGDAAAYTSTDAFDPPVPDPVDVDDLAWLPPVGDDAAASGTAPGTTITATATLSTVGTATADSTAAAGGTLTATATLTDGAATAGWSGGAATVTATATLTDGAAAADSATTAATLTATATLPTAGAATASSATTADTITATATLTAGTATAPDATVPGQTLTATASLTAGTASAPTASSPNTDFIGGGGFGPGGDGGRRKRIRKTLEEIFGQPAAPRPAPRAFPAPDMADALAPGEPEVLDVDLAAVLLDLQLAATAAAMDEDDAVAEAERDRGAAGIDDLMRRTLAAMDEDDTAAEAEATRLRLLHRILGKD